MRRINLFICVCVALFTLVNASVWEGGALSAASGELPENGLYIATNSFPGNTVVDITNLENGKTVRVTVSSGLDNPGLLAVLSNDAANAIDLPARSLGRIRMTQPADLIAFSRFSEGLPASGDPDYDPAAFVAMNGHDTSAEEIENNPAAETDRNEAEELIVDLPDETPSEEITAAAPPSANPPATFTPVWPGPAVITDDSVFPEDKPRIVQVPELPRAEPMAPLVPQVPSLPETSRLPAMPPESYALSLVPSESRPPERGPEPDPNYVIPGIAPAPAVPPARPDPNHMIPGIVPAPTAPANAAPDPNNIIPGITPAPAAPPVTPDPSSIIEPVRERPTITAEPARRAENERAITPPVVQAVFSAPTITSLEKGKYYLQIGAYSRPETVQSEIARIGSGLPLAIMNGGTEEKPVYRVLIGPVNLGESGALLQRFKVNYKDAFVRLGT